MLPTGMPAEVTAYLFDLMLKTLRENHSDEWCRDKLVGDMRRQMGEESLEEAVIAMTVHGQQVRRSAGAALAFHCKGCNGCKMAWRDR